MKYFIFQGNDHDCGFTSLKMLMAHLKKDKSYLYLERCKKKCPYSVADICQEAKLHGLSLSSYSCDDDYYDRLSPLSLTLIRNNHVVMIKKVNAKKITYLDPEMGKVTVKKDEFLTIWCRIIVEVESADCLAEMPRKRRSILPFKLRFLEAFGSLISSAILIVTFYLLNNQDNAIFSIIFLMLFLTTQIVENIIIHKEINFFDKQYIEPYFRLPKNQNKLSYLEFIAFKQNFFTNSRSLLSSVLVAFMTTFLLCFNDFRNVFVLLALILIKTLEMLVFQKSDETNRSKIDKYENKCFTNKETCSDYALKANMLANQTVSRNSLRQVIYIVISFAFALGMMFLTGNSGCNYVIFHFGLYYVGFISYSKLLIGLSLKKDMYKMECRFFDRCNL